MKSTQRNRAQRSTRFLVMAAVTAVPTIPTIAHGANKTYIGPFSGASANWNTGSNWNPAGAPSGLLDSALIVHSDSASRTVTLDISTSIGTVSIGNSGVGTNLLTQGAFDLAVISTERIGENAGEKGVHTQNGGNNSFGSLLAVGSAAGSNGTYNLNGGSVAVNGLLSTFYVGRFGTGFFNQSAGTMSIGVTSAATLLSLGDSAGSIGTYNLSGSGTITVLGTGGVNVGTAGTGVFTQSGGTHTIGTPEANLALRIANNVGSSGTYTLSGGSSALKVNGSAYIGGSASTAAGSGIVNLNGGTMTVTDTLKIWNSTGTSVNLTGGTLNVATLDTNGNASHFVWISGALNITGAGGLTISPAEPLGGNIYLTASHALTVTNTMSIDVNSLVNLDGGTLTAGALGVHGFVYGVGTVVAPVTVHDGGKILPGGLGPGTLSVAGLTLASGAKLAIDPGDRIDVTSANALSIAGPTNITLAGASAPGPILGYAGSLGGSVSQLRFGGGVATSDYSARNNAAAHTIDLVVRRVATHDLQAPFGQPAPVGIGTSTVSRFGSINDAGQAVSVVLVNGAFDGSPQVLIRTNPGASATTIMRVGQAAPGGGLLGSPYTNGYVAPNGEVTFGAELTGSSSTFGLFRGNGGAISAVLRAGDPLPGAAGGTCSFFSELTGSESYTAFRAGASGATLNGYEGIFRASGSTVIEVARTGQTAPGGGAYSTLTNPAVNLAGNVAFNASLTSAGEPRGIFRSSAGIIVSIARDGDSAPGSGGGTIKFDHDSYPTFRGMNFVNKVAFRAPLISTSDGSASGIFVGLGDALTLIAREKQVAPVTVGGTYGGVYITTPVINDYDEVAFGAQLIGSNDGSTGAIFRGDGFSPSVPIARSLQPAPGGGNFGTIFSSLAINGNGVVAFRSEFMPNTFDGIFDDDGLFIGDGKDLISIARSNQIVGNGRISHLNAITSINAFGQVGYEAYMYGTYTTSIVYTPVLHWRGPTVIWDSRHNWTLGTNPAFVHEVVIDPANPLTMTGPLDSRTIRSLTIGDFAGGGPATLKLGGTGVVLRTRETITIDTAGGNKLDLRDSKLITQSPAGLWNGSAYTGVTGLIATGRNGTSLPLWDGSGIVTSMTSATSGNRTSIGVARAPDIYPNIYFFTTVWAGQTILEGDTLVMYTYGGDANLDGKLNIDDYIRIDNGIASGLKGWSNGDFNYDGKINIDDYTTVIDANIGNQNGFVFPTAGGVDESSIAAVPEAASLSVALGGVALLVRRRRRLQG